MVKQPTVDPKPPAFQSLPIVQHPTPCNQCGACCMQGGPCSLLAVATGRAQFAGRCPELVQQADGRNTCGALRYVAEPGALWVERQQVWAPGAREHLVAVMGNGCSKPHLKRDLVPQAVQP